MECDICLIEWNSFERIPRLLSCGHTFCEVCLKAIIKKSQSINKQFVCPTCQSPQNIKTENDIEKLIKNYGLLSFVEKFKQNERQTTTSILKVSQDTPKHKKQIETQTSFDDYYFNINKRCRKHNLPYHSIIKETNELLCSKCIKEKNITNAEPILGVYEDLKRRIDSTQFRVFTAKNQIKHVQKFLQTYLERFESENQEQLEKVFNFYHQVINYFYQSSKQILDKCISHQKKKIDEFLVEIDTLMQEVLSIENEMLVFNSINDTSILLDNIDKIKKYQGRMINFINFDHEFDLFSMKIAFKDEERKNLFSAIQNSFLIDIDSLQIQGKSPTVGLILEVESTWPCICGEINNKIENIKCNNCGLLRRIETFSSNSSDLYEEFEDDEIEHEIQLFNLRRKIEMQEYEKILLSNEQSEEIFLISSNWLNQWEVYIKNESNKEIYNGVHKQIGVLPPGPIYNDNLIYVDKEQKFVLKEDISEGKDYKIVSPSIWDFFFLNYNGGPFIRLNKKDKESIGTNLKGYYYLNHIRLMDYNSMKSSYFKDAELDEEEEEKDSSSGEVIINQDDII